MDLVQRLLQDEGATMFLMVRKDETSEKGRNYELFEIVNREGLGYQDQTKDSISGNFRGIEAYSPEEGRLTEVSVVDYDPTWRFSIKPDMLMESYVGLGEIIDSPFAQYLDGGNIVLSLSEILPIIGRRRDQIPQIEANGSAGEYRSGEQW